MAQIIIREKDLTGAPAESTFDVAVVPGLVSNTSFTDFEKPIYFNTLASFKSVIGDKPVVLTGDGISYTLSEGSITCPAAAGASDVHYFFAGGELDPGYIYASELLTLGMPIYYLPIDATQAQGVYDRLEGANNVKSVLLQLVDRGTYNIKYITSGGYPTFEYNENSIAKLMLQVAGAINDETDDYGDDPTAEQPNGRGDAVALIDHFEVDDRPLVGDNSVFGRINGSDACSLVDAPFLSYGAMFTPYAKYKLANNYKIEDELISTAYLPASFAYLTCLAKQLNGILPTYQAIAGVGRGSVTNISFETATNSYAMCTKEVLTNYIANYYNIPMKAGVGPEGKLISINAITQINPYGMVIYGDRTLKEKDPIDGVKATGVLPIRAMVCDIKKQMYQTARRYMFSPNNEALWINFRNGVTGLLNQMQSGYGIKKYTLTKDMAKSTKNALYVNCSIVPIYPVEKFDITIEITDDDIEVNEA